MRVLEPEAYPPNPAPTESQITPAGTAPEPGSMTSEDPSAADDVRALVRGPEKLRRLRVARIRVERANNLTSVKPRRCRDKDHIRFIAIQSCIVCGRQPCEAHHLRFTQPRALGRRVSDEFTVPLCRIHHRELHRQGDERLWWNKAKIDPMPIALRFWQQTRGGLTATSDNKPQPTTGVATEERSGAAPSSSLNRNLPPKLFEVPGGGAS
jgi:hypothetical protein